MLTYVSKIYKDFSSAKTDIERIMQLNGYKNVGLPRKQISNAAIGFAYTLCSVIKQLFVLGKGDIVVIQYPLKKYFSLLCYIAHLRGAEVVVTIIHDLGSFRRKKLTMQHDIKRLNHADYTIAHNDAMRQWLEQNGIATRLARWVYLTIRATQHQPSAWVTVPTR